MQTKNITQHSSQLTLYSLRQPSQHFHFIQPQHSSPLHRHLTHTHTHTQSISFSTTLSLSLSLATLYTYICRHPHSKITTCINGSNSHRHPQQHTTTQHNPSTPQHSTAQRSAVQWSAVQRNTQQSNRQLYSILQSTTTSNIITKTYFYKISKTKHHISHIYIIHARH